MSEPAPIRGERVAWVMKTPGGKTCGISSIHRVAEDGKTYCGCSVPNGDRRFPPLTSLNVCRRCEALNARAQAYHERASA